MREGGRSSTKRSMMMKMKSAAPRHGTGGPWPLSGVCAASCGRREEEIVVLPMLHERVCDGARGSGDAVAVPKSYFEATNNQRIVCACDMDGARVLGVCARD